MKKTDLPPEIQKLIDENPVLMVVTGLVVLSALTNPSQSGRGPEVPGLGGRRNAAWRGKGSFGRAPFGSQISHRR